MKVEIGIRPNCSEWDEWLEDETYDSTELISQLNEIKKAAAKMLSEKDWD